MKSVSGASSSESKSSAKRWGCIAALLVGFLFIISLSNNNSSSGDNENLRSGQAKRPTKYTGGSGVQSGTKSAGSTGSGASKPTNKYKEPEGITEEEAEEEVAEAEKHFESVVKDQLGTNQHLITTSITKVLEGVREQLTTVLGDSDDFDSNDIDVLMGGIEEELTEEVQQSLQERTAVLVEQDDEDMEMAADLDTEGGDAGEDNEVVDLKDEESKLVVSLRDDVDEIATDERSKIRHRAALIAKAQLEKLLKERLGSTYIVSLDEDDTLVSYKKKSSSSSSSSSSGSSSSGHKSSSSSSSSSSHHKSSSSSGSSHHKSSSSGHHSSSGHKKSTSSSSQHGHQ